MYSVAPAAKAAWRKLLGWIVERSALRMEIVDHDPPAALADLWQRADLGCALMCGLPYSLRDPRPTLIAAPVPSLPRYAGRAVYFSDIAVRADSPYRTLEDTFGAVCGYTLADSMSGAVAFRRLLHSYRKAELPQLYRSVVGNLVNARGVIQALADHRIDVGPLDGYVHDLLQHNDPEFAAQVRVIETTDPTPMPPLVATARLSYEVIERIRAALLAVQAEPALASARAALLLDRFVVPDPSAYRVQRERAEAVERNCPPWP